MGTKENFRQQSTLQKKYHPEVEVFMLILVVTAMTASSGWGKIVHPKMPSPGR